MNEQERYYEKNYEESYYIFDSNTLTEKEFEKKVEYEGYDVFSDSLTPEEVLDLLNENEELKKRLSDFQKENYGNIDGIAFYQEENATLCEKISDLEYENEELKEKLNEDDKMRWSKKTENTVQDIDGEEYNIDEIVGALNHYQRTVDELRRENHELYNRVNENTNNIK